MIMSFCKRLMVFNSRVPKSSVEANPDNQSTSPNVIKKGRKTLSFIKSHNFLLRGSMAVEAALAVPLFLFLVINLLSLIVMYERYSDTLSSLHQQAKILSVSAYLNPTGDEMISLSVPQSISPMIKEIGFTDSMTIVTAKCRKWTGYDVLSYSETEEDDEYVYMTENGRVYHRSRNCNHLKITIQVVNPSELSYLRNENGEIYHKCEKCGNGTTTGALFITRQGNKYHNSVNCSGLSRRIKVVKLSDIPGVPGCGGCT